LLASVAFMSFFTFGPLGVRSRTYWQEGEALWIALRWDQVGEAWVSWMLLAHRAADRDDFPGDGQRDVAALVRQMSIFEKTPLACSRQFAKPRLAGVAPARWGDLYGTSDVIAVGLGWPFPSMYYIAESTRIQVAGVPSATYAVRGGISIPQERLEVVSYLRRFIPMRGSRSRPLFPPVQLTYGDVPTKYVTVPFLPLWSGLAANLVCHTAAWGVLLFGLGAVRGRWRAWKRRCPACDYELGDALPSGCPECGWNRAPTAEGTVGS
jgi:hypothetical protein